MIIMKNTCLFKTCIIIAFVMILSFPMFLWAIQLKIEEKDIEGQDNNMNHLYYFKICFDSQKRYSEHEHTYMLETVLYGKSKLFKEEGLYQQTPNNYLYNKEEHIFKYKNTSIEDRCSKVHSKYKLFVHDFEFDIDTIEVKEKVTDLQSRGLSFDSFKTCENFVIVHTPDSSSSIQKQWSTKTCCDKLHGFAYFTNENNMTCDNLFKVFNEAPLFNDKIEPTIIYEDKPLNQFFLPKNLFVDPDGDTYTCTVSNKPEWLRFNTSTQTFSGGPTIDDHAKTYTITVRANDSYNPPSEGFFVLIVKNVNDKPVGKDIKPQSVQQGQQFKWTFPADQFSDEENQLSYSAIAKFKDQNLPLSSTSSFWLKFKPSEKTFVGTPGNDNVGNYLITLTATEISSEQQSVSKEFSLQVININDPPVRTNIEINNLNYEPNQIIDYNISGYFSDPDNDSLRYEATLDNTNLPKWIKLNYTTGKFTGKAPNNITVTKSYNIKVTASDGKNVSDPLMFFLTVKPKPTVMNNEYSLTNTDSNMPQNSSIVPALLERIPVYVFEEGKEKTFYIKKSIFSDQERNFNYTLSQENETVTWLRMEPEKDRLKLWGTCPLINENRTYFMNLTVTNPNSSKCSTFSLHIKVIKNTPPSRNSQFPLNDITIEINKQFKHIIKKKIFIDNEPLDYTATKSNGKSLPKWLTFNLYSENMIFEGTPYKIETIDIKLTAKDKFNSTSDVFKIHVINPERITEEQEKYPSIYNEQKIFSLDGIYTTPCFATTIRPKGNKITLDEKVDCSGNKKCSFYAPHPIAGDLYFLWECSGTYIGTLFEESYMDKRILSDIGKNGSSNQKVSAVLKIKKPQPEQCAYIKSKNKKLDGFENPLNEIDKNIPKEDNETKQKIRGIINIEKFYQFYEAWQYQKSNPIQCKCDDTFCNLILLDEKGSYFQKFNNYWSYKTIDYKEGPILIPIPVKKDEFKLIEIIEMQNVSHENTPCEFSTAPTEQNIFEGPYPNPNDREYRYYDYFGMVHFNKLFRIPNDYEVKNLYITTFIDNNIVYSPVFCNDTTCKYYSPSASNSMLKTFVWRKIYHGYRFISSLPFHSNLRYSLINQKVVTKNNELFSNMMDTLYSTMKNNQIGDVCIKQIGYNKKCISDFFDYNEYSIGLDVPDQNSIDLKIGESNFKKDNRGDFIIFEPYCFENNNNIWTLKILKNFQVIETISIPSVLVRKIRREERRCFWSGITTYFETPIYHSNVNYYEFPNSGVFEIGNTNFQRLVNCEVRPLPKWIIVDEFEDAESSIMTQLFSNFRKYDLKQLIKDLSQRTFRLDGIKGNYIKRIHTSEPDYATRNFANFANAITSIEPHENSRLSTHWELHVFVPRKTSITSFNVSENKLREIKQKFRDLNVARFCLWEFSNQKPLEETAYEKFMNLLNTPSFRHKAVYNQNHISEIFNIILQ